MSTARFCEFLAVEHLDLNVFILQPGVVCTALYEKGKLQLDNTIDSGETLTTLSKVQDQADISTSPVTCPLHCVIGES